MDPTTLLPSRAAGFVLSRAGPGGRVEYLLLRNRRDGMPGFPKGHRDGDERDLETALRETREETGLSDLEVVPGFSTSIAYPVRKGAEARWKTVVYFRARWRGGEVTLSDEHTAHEWLPFPAARHRFTFDSLRDVLLRAACHGKDPALFDAFPPDVAAADRHLAALPHADAALLGHLRGGARLARRLAEALASAGAVVNPEAAEAGTLLHDVGRALGQHEEHQVAGVRHLLATPLAPYGFACVTHFTKGAGREALRAAGLASAAVEGLEAATDLSVFTWEERCAALADACMKGATPVAPAERFRDLRARYPGAEALVALQERRTEVVRADFASALGRDPVALLGLV